MTKTGNTLRKIRTWWYLHRWRITTKDKENLYMLNCLDELNRINNNITFSTLRPVIFSLKELRNNTWDVERVDKIIDWLEDNFKYEERL